MFLLPCFRRLLQGRPHRVLDVDVLHVLHGEPCAPAGRHAVLRAAEALLRRRGQHRGQEGEEEWFH